MGALGLRVLVFVVAGWLQRSQLAAIEYLLEENRVLREHIGAKRLRFTDEQRRRLAANAKELTRDALNRVAGIVTPDTLLRWYRQLVAAKYDGSTKRKTGATQVEESRREAGDANRERVPRLGLHAHSRCAIEPRSRYWTQYDRQNLEGRRS
jgi:transposase-like protein